jgi:hypothetical protein
VPAPPPEPGSDTDQVLADWLDAGRNSERALA